MKKLTIFALILTLVFCYTGCKTTATNKPNTTNKPDGIATPPTENKSKQVDLLLSNLVGEATPGVSVLVGQGGKVIYQKGFGVANLENKTPIKADTIFYLASVSKQFTAMAIMILAEEGKLSYTDPITKFFPEFPEYAQKITVNHLLYHTGGLKDYMDVFEDENSVSNSTKATKKVIDYLAKKSKPAFAAGKKYSYSNSGYVVLAGIVEQASKKSYPEYLKEKVFKPLSMDNTSVITTLGQMPKNLARGYSTEGSNKYEDAKLGETSLDLVYGDGGVLSTVEDLYKWDQALYTEKLVKQDTLKLAFTSGRTNDDEKIDYGFGWSVYKFLGEKVIEHDGSWYGWSTVICRLPQEQFTVILLSNDENFEAIKVSHNIAKIYLKEETKD